MSKGKKEGETNQGRQTKTNQPILFTLENTLMVTGRGGGRGDHGDRDEGGHLSGCALGDAGKW